MGRIRSIFSNFARNSTRPPFSGDVDGYSEFDTTGHVRSSGDGTAWIDINFDVVALALGASSPTLKALSGGTIIRPHFGTSVATSISGAAEIDHNVKIAIIRPHLHWITTDTDTGDVFWQLAYTVANSEDIEPSETTITVASAGTGNLHDNVRASFPAIDITGHNVGAQFSMRMFRDPTHGSDNYTGEAAVKTFGLHCEIQSLGSRGISDETD
jgi:hypothetical protein